MRRIFILLIAICFLILISFFQQLHKGNNVIINGISFKAEFANSTESKRIGLSKYKKIDDNFVMVFPFEESGKPVFWMKGMHFPIDIIFVNENRITQIYSDVKNPEKENSPLPLYIPDSISDMVIEASAGTAKKYNFKKGNKIEIIK